MVYEISQPKRGPCEIASWLQNDFAAPCTPSAKIFAAAKLFAAAKHPFGTRLPFRSYEILYTQKHQFSQPHPYFVGGFAAAKPPLSTRVPFRSPPPSFRSCEMGCENAHPLRNPPLTAKSTICCENNNRLLASFLNFINSIFHLDRKSTRLNSSH